jgi:O-antigen ligase
MNRLSSIAFFLLAAILVGATLLYGAVHQSVMALFYLSILLLAVIWAAEAFTAGKLRFSRSLLQVPLIALGVYAVLQAIPLGTTTDASGIGNIQRTISQDIFSTRATAVHIFALAIFAAAAFAYTDSASRLRRLASFITIFGFAYAFYAILQSVLSPDAIYGLYKPEAKPFGSFVNRNDYASLLVMLMSVPLGMLFSGSVARDKRLLYGVAVALMATSVILSQSRGGLLALIIEVLLLAIITTGTRGKKKLALRVALSFAVLLAAVGGALFVGGETSFHRLSGDAVANEAPTETTSRFHIWTVTTKMIVHNLPFGVGLGAYSVAYPQFDTGSGLERVEQSHNDYLQILADAGVVGGVIGFGFLFLLFQKGREAVAVDNKFRRGIAAGALCGMTAVLVHSFFDFVLHITAIALAFITLLAMLVASSREYDDDVRDVDEPKRGRKATISDLKVRSGRSSRRAVE